MLRLALLAQAALALALLCSLAIIGASAAPAGDEVVVVDLAMDIDGGAEELIRRAVSYATAHGAVRALVLQINTDGGYAHNMQAILDLLASLAEHNITTVAFVAPEGARCRSAGAYIFMACDITAMAPGTSVGACMPVDVAGNPAGEKVVNAFAAQMRGLAEARGRNATAAHEMVVENKAFTAEEAHRYGICDIIAEDLNDLLARPELGLAEAVRIYFEPDLRVRFLSFISNPLVQSLLMWAAVMLIMIDIFHPTFVMTVIALALLAVALEPRARDYLFAGHLSAERGHSKALEHLRLEPLLQLEMRLGEGTGATLAFVIIEAAVKILSQMATFSSAGVSRGL